jgi:UDP-2-acetamido-2,6-beta-L-arabino-hexul-4-ose reductase
MIKLKIGITGHTGFIGSHLVDRLKRDKQIAVILIDDDSFNDPDKLDRSVEQLDRLVHLAGQNRGAEEEIYSTNIALAEKLVASFERLKVTPHLIFASSILSGSDSAFGRSKKAAGQSFEAWAEKNKAPLSLLTIPNVFGDRGRPFYNSVVATFCHQLTHNDQPKIIEDRKIELIFINDLTELIYEKISVPPPKVETVRIKGTEVIAVSDLLKMLDGFRDHFGKRLIPKIEQKFQRDLYNTFISYVEPAQLVFYPAAHADKRGNLFEIIQALSGGQVFFSVTNKGVIRGEHYHSRKIERFCVVKGRACIRLRRIGTNEVHEYNVDAARPGFVDIPIFYTHNIENTGQEDLHTIFWCNEIFDQADPDTYHEEVKLK